MPAETIIKLRRGTAAQWTTANPVLAAGEMGVETDTNRSKFGDGATTWTSLAYAVGDSSGIGTIEWTSVQNKPTEFTPSAHTHTSEELNWSYYSSFADLPSASTKHGMVAHVHSEGTLYYAHAGQWVLVAKDIHTHVMSDITDLEFPPTTILSDTAPVSPVNATRWVDTTNFTEYIYYDSYWVEV